MICIQHKGKDISFCSIIEWKKSFPEKVSVSILLIMAYIVNIFDFQSSTHKNRNVNVTDRAKTDNRKIEDNIGI